jgi:hypothetical protein
MEEPSTRMETTMVEAIIWAIYQSDLDAAMQFIEELNST